MRRLLPAFLFLLFAFACTPDSPVKTGKDSLPDSALVNNSGIDTFHVDSGSTTQTYYDCSVLNKKIPSDSDEQVIRHDLAQLVHCGIDSFDFLYVVPNLFPGFVSENHVSGKKVTYGEFVKHVDEFRTTDAYRQLHQRVETLDSLRHSRYDHAKLYMMKPVLGKLGFTEPEWEMFYGFANTYEVPKNRHITWGELLDEFDKYRPDK
jgi:hypothetical protein